MPPKQACHAIADALEQEAQRLRTFSSFYENRQALTDQLRAAADPEMGWGEGADPDESLMIASIAQGDIEVIELTGQNTTSPRNDHDEEVCNRLLHLRIGKETLHLAFQQVLQIDAGGWCFGRWDVQHAPTRRFAGFYPAVAELIGEGVFSRHQPDVARPESALGEAVSEQIQGLVAGQLKKGASRSRASEDDGPSLYREPEYP